ncbi:MAG: phosphocarrier protein HPr [Gammaproteobacteria bacterium]|jgi:phosphocarrier protein|nr:phosphocarrier protein HPr [Gammaproteobacteria bacterium]HJN94240.1 HPr family phosphocarrier protein [Gammaproteobacteria bacterium]|tara:strand:- start:9929 stop:10195 length:267 start_codon:yes stop_codon:yes gene_type:complete
MVRAKVEVINKAGLHARAASKLVELTTSFASDIQVGHEKTVDGKSILSLMMLAAVKGTELTIEASGTDEDQALSAVVALISDRFGESE